MRRKVKLPAPSANGTASEQELYGPLGLEVYALYGVVTGGAAAAITDITNIRPQVNNASLWDGINGQDLDEINKFDKLTPYVTNSILKISFENEIFIDGVPRMATSINTGVKSKKTGKIITNWGLKYATGTATQFTWWAEVEDADPLGPGFVQRLTKKTSNPPVNGTDIDNLPYGDANNAQWRRLFIKMAAGTVIDVTLKVGDKNAQWIEKVLKAMNNQGLLDTGKVVGAYFDFVLDFSEHNMPNYLETYHVNSKGLVTKFPEKSMKLLVNNDTAAAQTVIVNTIGEI